jgi:hypothetical protein
MRKVAAVHGSPSGVRRLMLASGADGVLVFTYSADADGPSDSDAWFATVEEAEAACCVAYGVDPDEWAFIADALPGRHEDWICSRRLGNGRQHAIYLCR